MPLGGSSVTMVCPARRYGMSRHRRPARAPRTVARAAIFQVPPEGLADALRAVPTTALAHPVLAGRLRVMTLATLVPIFCALCPEPSRHSCKGH